MQIRRRIFVIIQASHPNDTASRIFDIGLIFLIFLNSIFVIADTFQLNQDIRKVFSIIETVGYGDIYPIAPIGKLLTVIIAILGIGLVVVPTGIISAVFLESLQEVEKKELSVDEMEYCPYCGRRIH